MIVCTYIGTYVPYANVARSNERINYLHALDPQIVGSISAMVTILGILFSSFWVDWYLIVLIWLCILMEFKYIFQVF
jgi:hypothetical protein